MEKTVWAAGWDGEWFRRAYDDLATRLGRRKTPKGRSSSSRRASVMAGRIGIENGNAVKALDSVEKYLATPHGIVLQNPAFSQYYLHLGEISSYPPGYKENAGIFCHTNPWIMIAEPKPGAPTRRSIITSASAPRRVRRSATAHRASRTSMPR
jgi:cellobiose phosphorylase